MAVIYLGTLQHRSCRRLHDCSRLLAPASNRLYPPTRRLLQGGLPFSPPCFRKGFRLCCSACRCSYFSASLTTDPIWTVNDLVRSLLALKLSSPHDTPLFVARTFLWFAPATALLPTRYSQTNGSGAGTRTPTDRFKVCCPTIRRHPNIACSSQTIIADWYAKCNLLKLVFLLTLTLSVLKSYAVLF